VYKNLEPPCLNNIQIVPNSLSVPFFIKRAIQRLMGQQAFVLRIGDLVVAPFNGCGILFVANLLNVVNKIVIQSVKHLFRAQMKGVVKGKRQLAMFVISCELAHYQKALGKAVVAQ
jgi:hypothetical protein